MNPGSKFSSAPPPASKFSSAPPSGFAQAAFPPAAAMPAFPSSGSRILNIPNDKVGLVIGRGGETVKQVQLDSGANVQIAHECLPGVTTREITITGSDSQVQFAANEINRIVDTASTGRRETPGLGYNGGANDNTFVMRVPHNVVGLIIGKGGDTIRTIQQSSGAHMQVQRDAEVQGGIDKREVNISGTPTQIELAKSMVEALIAQKEQETQANQQLSQGGGAGSHSGIYDGKPTVTITIPNQTVGMIIGRGGETIKGLIHKTNCKIQISKDSQQPQREVTLTGGQAQIEHAKQEVFALVAEAESRNGGGGHGGPRGGGYGGHGGPGGYGGYGGYGAQGGYGGRPGYNQPPIPYGGGGYGGGGPGGYGAPGGYGQGGYGGYGGQAPPVPQGQYGQPPPPSSQPPSSNPPQPSSSQSDSTSESDNKSAAPGASGANAPPSTGQYSDPQMAAYAAQYFQYYGQAPPPMDPAYVQQWQQAQAAQAQQPQTPQGYPGYQAQGSTGGAPPPPQ